ncbi:MAG TPA: class III extradiol ring-cleavage dioxygenase [Arenibaculum sp.]|nr:class III extradiol ring-cleavage dioxygenase [Arenibaculum sp.]
MTPLPALFISHGSPMIAVADGPARRFLTGLGRQLGRPAAVLVLSAHWETDVPTLGTAERPGTIHDFGGFPRDLYALRYPAPGAPAVAGTAAALLRDAGLDVRLDPQRGLDHGAWIPLLLMYAQADVPVLQLSVQPGLGPRHHFALGTALRRLRDEGVLVLGSGSLTHNLGELFRGPAPNEASGGVPDWVTNFADWIADRIAAGDTRALLEYRTLAPAAERNHPTDEHLLPLFAALGAGTPGVPGRRLHSSVDAGILAMDAYAFD